MYTLEELVTFFEDLKQRWEIFKQSITNKNDENLEAVEVAKFDELIQLSYAAFLDVINIEFFTNKYLLYLGLFLLNQIVS